MWRLLSARSLSMQALHSHSLRAFSTWLSQPWIKCGAKWALTKDVNWNRNDEWRNKLGPLLTCSKLACLQFLHRGKVIEAATNFYSSVLIINKVRTTPDSYIRWCHDMSGGCPPRRRPDNFVRWKERKPLARTIILEGTPISAGADVDKWQILIREIRHLLSENTVLSCSLLQ